MPKKYRRHTDDMLENYRRTEPRLEMTGSTSLPTRRYKRRPIERQVAILCRGQFNFGRASQLSEGGMLLNTDREFINGDLLELSFFVSETEFVTMIGQVIYRLDSSNVKLCFGIRFLDMLPQTQFAIRRFVESESAPEAY